MNDLEYFFSNHADHRIHKWHHYFEIYDRHFSGYRDKPLHLLEIGVKHGGSLQMWKHYFGAEAHIYGVDVNPECKKLEEERVQIFIGDQAERDFLTSLTEQIPRIDILIDDGGHTMVQQINTFEVMFPHVDANGTYVVEDMHSSYWREFGGGYGESNSFAEYAKHFIDAIHAWHSEQTDVFEVSDFTRSAHGLHFYDSVLVIEKRPMQAPFRLKSGKGTLAKKGLLGKLGIKR